MSEPEIEGKTSHRGMGDEDNSVDVLPPLSSPAAAAAGRPLCPTLKTSHGWGQARLPSLCNTPEPIRLSALIALSPARGGGVAGSQGGEWSAPLRGVRWLTHYRVCSGFGDQGGPAVAHSIIHTHIVIPRPLCCPIDRINQVPRAR